MSITIKTTKTFYLNPQEILEMVEASLRSSGQLQNSEELDLDYDDYGDEEVTGVSFIIKPLTYEMEPNTTKPPLNAEEIIATYDHDNLAQAFVKHLGNTDNIERKPYGVDDLPGNNSDMESK